MVAIPALPLTSPLMEQVTRKCVVKQEDIRRACQSAFITHILAGQTIDGYYADGLLIIVNSSPREHIWTYTVGRYENRTDCCNCHCAAIPGYPPPSFVGTSCYCETGTNYPGVSGHYFNDPLWDGSGCDASNCCNNPLLPWFHKELSRNTTSDIEARICTTYGSGSSALIDQLELFVQ